MNSDDEAAYNGVLKYPNKRVSDNGAKRFLIGDHITIADIYFSTAFTLPYACKNDYKKYSHLVAYSERL